MKWIKHTFAGLVLILLCYILFYSYSYPENLVYFPTELDQQFSTLDNKYQIPVGVENILAKEHNIFIYLIFLNKIKIVSLLILIGLLYFLFPRFAKLKRISNPSRIT